MAFSARHLPGLGLATVFTISGVMPLYNAQYAIEEFGLPPHMASSKPAQAIMTVSCARGTAIGLALFAFYYKRWYQAMDVVLTTMAWVGAVDVYICWREGVRGRGLFGAAMKLLFGIWGACGGTESQR